MTSWGKGSCLAWRNTTTGEEYVQGPNERMRRAGAIARAGADAMKRAALSPEYA